MLDSKGLFMKSYNSVLACLLFIFSSTALAVDFTLPSGQWRLISLPANPPEQKNTVESIFGDDIGGEYGSRWVLFEFDAETNGYHKLLKSDSIAIGKGYWITQVTGHPVILDMPAGSANLLTSSVPLVSSGNNQVQWNLLGYPFSVSGNLNDFSVKAAHVNTDDNDLMPCLSSGCPFDMNNLVYDHVWIYDGGSYVDKNMSGSWGIGAELESWDGFWIAVQNNKGYDLSLNARHPKTEVSSVDALVIDGKNIMLTMSGRFPKDNHQGFFIDSDNNPDTGYAGGFKEIHGADYLLQGNGLHKYPENGRGWTWDKVSSEARVIETSIAGVKSRASTNYFPLSLLNVGNTLRFTAVTTTSDWSKNYYYPQMKTYQVGGIEPPSTPVVIIGPSTVYIDHEFNEARHSDGSDCRLEGWGERLYEYATDPDVVYNYAQPGAGAGTFREPPEGKERLEQMHYGPDKDHYWAGAKKKMEELRRGMLLIQFGGNDPRHLQKKYPGATREQIGEYFKENIRFYIDRAKELNFTPVLITSIEKRIRENNGDLKHSRGRFPEWIKEIAEDENIRVLDLNKKSYEEFSKYTDAQWDEKFANCFGKWGGQKQNTHFEPKGAKIVASWLRDLACEDSDSKLCKQLRGTPQTFKLSSNNFIPEHGSPQLSWKNVPKGAKSFALIIDDQDAKDDQRDWIHWSVMNINKNVTSIAANTTPDGVLVELNSNRSRSYADPAFPKNHTYVAHVYALDIEDISKVEQANRDKIYYPNSQYDHKTFEKIFANFILEKSRIVSQR